MNRRSWYFERGCPFHMRIKRVGVDLLCVLIGHRWWRNPEIDAGRGYCTRCGLNRHIWLPLPTEESETT